MKVSRRIILVSTTTFMLFSIAACLGTSVTAPQAQDSLIKALPKPGIPAKLSLFVDEGW